MRLLKHATMALLGLLVSAIIAEGMLRALPVQMGLYRTSNHDKWPLYAYQPHREFSYSTTWQMLLPNRGATNNYGHIAPFDYVPGSQPIVVIGDSFVEALMNRFGDTLQGALSNLLAGRIPVYGLGFSGNSLAEYLATARLARDEFAPVALVILIIDNDVAESWLRRPGHRYFAIEHGRVREEYLPLSNARPAQRLRVQFGDSALYRYIQANLGFSVDMIFARSRPSTTDFAARDDAGEANSQSAIDYFLVQLPVASGVDSAHIALVFDSDRDKIYDPHRSPRSGLDSRSTQGYFREHARSAGYQVVDTQSVFAEHFGTNHRKFDYSPTDRHWNGLGHQLAAARVAALVVPMLCESDRRLRASPSIAAALCQATAKVK